MHSSIGFDLSVTSLFAPLMVGQRVVLLPEDGATLAALLGKQKDFSLVKLTPAHLAVLGRDLRIDMLSKCTRVLVIGGEALTFESLTLWAKYAPATRLINEYGPTEAVVGCCVYEIHPGTLASGAVPIGRPIANTRIYILDGHLQPVPSGVIGEILIGGDGVARGYLNRPELTAHSFIMHSFDGVPAQRLFRTGDLGRYLADGNIEFLGRLDDQVKIRGYRIELGEIEAVLGQHPAVSESAVMVKQDSVGDKSLVAYVVSRESGPAISELRAYLTTKLPDYMVPSFFVMLEHLPLTSNGKVDRSALPSPDRDGADSNQVYVGPRNPVEKTIAGIWEEVLGRTQIGMHDNFFELGGHSLKATQVVSRLRTVFQSEIPLRHLFEFPTIAELAAAIDSKARAELKNDNLAELLTEIEAMPEEEAQDLLGKKRNG